VSIDFAILVDGLFELGFGDSGFFLVYNIDEKPFLILAGSILFDILVPPLNVAAVLLLELSFDLTEKNRNGLLLLFLLYFHRLTLLDVPYQLANSVLP
jgi:hypothetical protein